MSVLLHEVPGWRSIAAIPGGHEDVMQCQGVLCGALVRKPSRRESHDREFHEDKPDSIRAWDLRLALTLLAADGNVSSDWPCSLDHHGNCQEHGHFDFDGECPTVRARGLVAKYGITQEEVDAL